MKDGKSVVTVFGSAFPKEGSEEYKTAYDLGRILAQSGYIVCNGGYGGTMEASARGAKEAGGTTIGVVTEVFGIQANGYIDEKIVTKTHSDRLFKLIEVGDAYVVLRGGTGTLVELATAWEYMNKGIISKKPLIVVGEFWMKVTDTVQDELRREGKAETSGYVTLSPSPKECVMILNKRLRQK